MRLRDSTVALPRRWDCVFTDTSASRKTRKGAGSRIKVPHPIPRDVTPSCQRWGRNDVRERWGPAATDALVGELNAWSPSAARKG